MITAYLIGNVIYSDSLPQDHKLIQYVPYIRKHFKNKALFSINYIYSKNKSTCFVTPFITLTSDINTTLYEDVCSKDVEEYLNSRIAFEIKQLDINELNAICMKINNRDTIIQNKKLSFDDKFLMKSQKVVFQEKAGKISIREEKVDKSEESVENTEHMLKKLVKNRK